jgi:hypothetical protein
MCCPSPRSHSAGPPHLESSRLHSSRGRMGVGDRCMARPAHASKSTSTSHAAHACPYHGWPQHTLLRTQLRWYACNSAFPCIIFYSRAGRINRLPSPPRLNSGHLHRLQNAASFWSTQPVPTTECQRRCLINLRAAGPRVLYVLATY